jgi:hypothetical protein
MNYSPLDVGVNYSNANQSNPLSNKQLATSYVGALLSSVGTAVGMSNSNSILKGKQRNLSLDLLCSPVQQRIL